MRAPALALRQFRNSAYARRPVRMREGPCVKRKRLRRALGRKAAVALGSRPEQQRPAEATCQGHFRANVTALPLCVQVPNALLREPLRWEHGFRFAQGGAPEHVAVRIKPVREWTMTK